MKLDKTEILTMLREKEGYVSGQELCERLGVSRSAVWKVMGQLKKDGYEIDSVSRKGYLLKSAPDILSEGEIISRMRTKWAGRKVCYFAETDSTNTRAKHFAELGASHGTLVVADMQNTGKGRRGKVWQQSPGTMVSMSLILKPEFVPDKASMLTLVAAYSVAQGIEKVTEVSAKIKWPNDIVINQKKVCGILTEMSVSMEQELIDYVVVGIGVNVNVSTFPEDIRDIATSLVLESGKRVNRSELIREIMGCFEEAYEMFLKTEDLSGILEDYNRRLASMDREVKVLEPRGSFMGISRGINKKGELLVEKKDGSRAKVYAGEVSVRGLYGYV